MSNLVLSLPLSSLSLSNARLVSSSHFVFDEGRKEIVLKVDNLTVGVVEKFSAEIEGELV